MTSSNEVPHEGTVPSPSHDEMMNTGLPLLNLAARLFVTACSGIVPLGATPASDERILKYCLSPVSGGKKDNFSSYIVRETESRLLRKKDARLAAATVPISNGFLRTVPILGCLYYRGLCIDLLQHLYTFR